MEGIQELKKIIEALLMVSENGLDENEIKNVVVDVNEKEVREAIEVLKEEYSSEERAFYIAEIAGKVRIATKPEYVKWVSSLYQKKSERLTGPSLETLAILAYKQPATRAEIEAVRGVNVGGVINTLLEKDLIRVRGRKNVIGKPLLYGTTEKFLELFGLNSLDDLPMLRDFSQEDLEYGKPQDDQIIEKDKGPGEKQLEMEDMVDGSKADDGKNPVPKIENTENTAAEDEATEAGSDDERGAPVRVHERRQEDDGVHEDERSDLGEGRGESRESVHEKTRKDLEGSRGRDDQGL